MNFKDKIKNYGFWTSLAAGVVLIVDTVAKQFGVEISAGVFGDIIMSVCGVLVMLGIVSNPSKGKWWTDSSLSEDEHIFVDEKNDGNIIIDDEKNKEDIIDI